MKITYEAIQAFLHYETVEHSKLFRAPPNQDQKLRLVKLGSCYGGWDCTSPSYLAPAHYKAFRDFTK